MRKRPWDYALSRPFPWGNSLGNRMGIKQPFLWAFIPVLLVLDNHGETGRRWCKSLPDNELADSAGFWGIAILYDYLHESIDEVDELLVDKKIKTWSEQ